MAQVVNTFQDLLDHIVGLSPQQRNAVIQEGYDSLDTIALWSYKDTKEFAKTKANARVQADRVVFGAIKVKNLQALAFWSKDMLLRGHRVQIQDYTTAVQASYRDLCEIENAYADATKETVDLPPPIKDDTDFTKWDKALTNALRSRRSIQGGPMSYIIRRDTDQVQLGINNQPDRESELEINMPHHGSAFDLDNRNAFNLIFALIDGTPAEAWVQRRTISTRSAVRLMQELRGHFDGSDHKEMVLKKAEATLNDTYYRCQETTFSWETYTTKIKDAYEQIAHYDSAVSDRMQVEHLLKHIVIPTNAPIAFFMAVQHVRNYKATTYATLNAAAAYLKAQIVDLFPNHENANRKRNINSSEVQVVKKQGKEYVAGVDITDRTRRFTPEEWKKLKDTGYVPTLLAEKRKQKAKKISGVTTGTEKVDDTIPETISLTREQVASISASYQASQNQQATNHSQQNSNQSANRGNGNPRAGANVGATATDASSVVSGITNDGATWTIPINRRTSAIRIQSHHYRNAYSLDTSAYQSSSITTPLPTESDNHADTHCFGANFRPLNWANYTCTVAPFLDELDTATEIPICQAATAWDSPDGITFILTFGQGLYFGERMKNNSLINPNQCRAFGIQFCDDPTDPFRSLGIHDPVTGINIPMHMNGTFAALLTRLPSLLEIEEAQKYNRIIHLSDPDIWNPHTFKFQSQVSATAADYDFPNDPHIIEPEALLGQISDTLVPSKFAHAVVSSCYAMSPAIVYVADSRTNERHHSVSPELLSQKWSIPLSAARATIKGTTQLAIRSARLPLSRRYRTDTMRSDLRRLHTTIYTDTLYGSTPSLRLNKYAQLFTDGVKDAPFVTAYPFQRKEGAGDALKQFLIDYGVMSHLHSDSSAEQTGQKTEFQKVCLDARINHTRTEPKSPWQNRSERTWNRIKTRMLRRMQRFSIPKKLWDYVLQYECEIMSRTHTDENSRCGLERVTGDSVDISDYVDFEFYETVYYWDEDLKCEEIGKWLGVAHKVGSALCYWILTSTGTILARSTVQHIPLDDTKLPEFIHRQNTFNATLNEVMSKNASESVYIDNEEDINQLLLSKMFMEGGIGKLPDGYFIEEPPLGPPPTKDIDDLHNNVEEQHELYDGYIGAEVRLPYGDSNRLRGKVTKRARGDDGQPIRKHHSNLILSTAVYEVEFLDGTTQEYAANVIAENIFSQVDSEGNYYQLLKEIVDHRILDDAIPIEDGTIMSKNGQTRPKLTTRGWELQVEWNDGSTTWVPLRDLKECNPVQLAEYAVHNNLQEWPAFAWWVPFTMRNQKKIISRVKTRYWEKSHKFGVELPKSVSQALEIDKRNGNDFWAQAIAKEMKNVLPAFEKRDDLTKENVKEKLVGYNLMKCHMVFDIKLDGNFTRKARLVANGALARGLISSGDAYSSVVSRDSVRIAFLIAALNDLDIEAADIGNAYLNADCREKWYVVAGPEFGSDQGKIFIVKKALYGLMTSGAAWRAHLSNTITSIGFKPTRADPDVYIRPAIHSNGSRYYEMILVYVDDLLVLSHSTSSIMDTFAKTYRLKEGSRGPPTRYLGGNIKRYTCGARILRGMTPDDYITNAIKTVEGIRRDTGLKPLKSYGKKASTRPYPAEYKPELDVSPELGSEGVSTYLQLIGILRWAVELGQLNIYTEVSVLSQHQCLPREGHLDAVYKIFWYLKNAQQARILFDPTHIDLSSVDFGVTDVEQWKDFYADAVENLPPDMPEPRGKHVEITCFVDSDHASNLLTRRSHTGILLYLQNSPIIWYSKRQNTVESSSFGSEFVALRIATEMIEALRYKLRMFGVPISGPARVLCDNKSVVTNASIPSSMLNKKHNSICYHRVRECQANGTITVGWIQSEYNQADLFTKTTISTGKKWEIHNEIFGWRVEPPIIELESHTIPCRHNAELTIMN